jgi:hypothetical protein
MCTPFQRTHKYVYAKKKRNFLQGKWSFKMWNRIEEAIEQPLNVHIINSMLFTIMFWVFHDTDIQECISNPLHCYGYIVDSMQHNFCIQVFNKIFVQTTNKWLKIVTIYSWIVLKNLHIITIMYTDLLSISWVPFTNDSYLSCIKRKRTLKLMNALMRHGM